MKPKFIKLAFTKEFFAKLLLVKKEDIRYVFLVYKDEEQTIRRAAISVRGIDEWIYDIETANFYNLGKKHSIEKATVVKTKNEVTFQNLTGYTQAICLCDFYRNYMTKVANMSLV